MRNALWILCAASLLVTPIAVAAQDNGQVAAPQSGGKPEEKKAETGAGPKFTRALTNVQIELTISDQLNAATPQKKTVSMIVAANSWGKIRAGATAYTRSREFPVNLNVDARPFISMDQMIQLELTMFYSPLFGQAPDSEQVRPTELNQSLTVVLQNGRPLTISQAADPITDRKITVDVKATILK